MSCVLIVEDEKRLRDIVRDYFTGHGLDCDLARDGAEALDLLRDHDYEPFCSTYSCRGWTALQSARR